MNRFFLFVTTCMYTESRSKTITYPYIDENAFITSYFWHGLHWMHSEEQCPIPRRCCHLQKEILPTLVPRLKNGLKLVAQQNQDACIPHICFVMLLDSRLDFRSRTTIRIGPMINLIALYFQQHYCCPTTTLCDASQVNYEKSITTYRFQHSASVISSTVRGKTKLMVKH